ncbi:2OG-Fe(II) oxygenase [Streptomyces roseifaciens]|uniref:2OG-Fe(II) oxygenase n=1 Tax=Streptomyces roseifaciens TaxID=1488406 RepID=UPI001C1F66E2|nr:2OG-Fe(II) oxygenase [Streptomyces roseifaciens]
MVEPPLLGALARAMRAGEGRPAEVLTPTGRRVGRHVRRTSAVRVPPAVAEPVRRRFEALRDTLADRFGVPLGHCETPQFLRYEHGDRFVPHADVTASGAGFPALRRRVSAVLHVAQDPVPSASGGTASPKGATASCGSLTFFDTSPDVTWQTCRVKVAVDPGSVIAFPSDAVHEVPPVRTSSRLTVAVWFWDP